MTHKHQKRLRLPSTIMTAAMISISTLLTASPSKAESKRQGDNRNKTFKRYWHQGKAEITSYQLNQFRYRDQHPGHATLIFVTEDFSLSKQVKLDNPRSAAKDAVPILKLNFNRHFNTGIYPYHTMMSVFTPYERADFPYPLKVATSSQEWCGHTFMQINKGTSSYKLMHRSYFESEGDKDDALPLGWLEDEIWTLARCNPKSLPTGTFKMLPATLYLRLRHVEAKYQKATGSLTSDPDNMQQLIYKLIYPDLKRTVSLHITSRFPHYIEKWTETQQQSGQRQTTVATRDKRIMLDYWSKNSLKDRGLRAQLDLPLN